MIELPIDASATVLSPGDQFSVEIIGAEQTHGIGFTFPAHFRIDSAEFDGVACAIAGQQTSCDPNGADVTRLRVVATALEPGYGLTVRGSTHGFVTLPGFPVEVAGYGEIDLHVVGDLDHVVGLDDRHCRFLDRLVADLGFANAASAARATTTIVDLLAPTHAHPVLPHQLPLGEDCELTVTIPAPEMIAFGDGAAAWGLAEDDHLALGVGTALAIIEALLSPG